MKKAVKKITKSHLRLLLDFNINDNFIKRKDFELYWNTLEQMDLKEQLDYIKESDYIQWPLSMQFIRDAYERELAKYEKNES